MVEEGRVWLGGVRMVEEGRVWLGGVRMVEEGQLGEVRMGGDVRMVGRSGDGPARPITDM